MKKATLTLILLLSTLCVAQQLVMPMLGRPRNIVTLINLGDDSVESNVTGAGHGDSSAGVTITPASNFTTVSVSLYLNNSNTNQSIRLGIYANDGAGGAPGTFICQAPSTIDLPGGAGSGWVSTSISCSLTGGQTYWLAWLMSADVNLRGASSTTAYYEPQSCTFMSTCNMASIASPSSVSSYGPVSLYVTGHY